MNDEHGTPEKPQSLSDLEGACRTFITQGGVASGIGPTSTAVFDTYIKLVRRDAEDQAVEKIKQQVDDNLTKMNAIELGMQKLQLTNDALASDNARLRGELEPQHRLSMREQTLEMKKVQYEQQLQEKVNLHKEMLLQREHAIALREKQQELTMEKARGAIGDRYPAIKSDYALREKLAEAGIDVGKTILLEAITPSRRMASTFLRMNP